MFWKEKAGISWSLCVSVCFCSRRAAACQNERGGIYLRDLNCRRTPSFQLISAFAPFSSSFVQTNSILGLKLLEQCSKVCECVCLMSACVLGGWQVYHRGFLVLFFWQRKLPSEWDSKRSTRPSMSVCIGPGILNCHLCVCIYGCVRVCE